MSRPVLPKVEAESHPECRSCGGAVRLYGIERHPSRERTDLLTYVCTDCDAVQTEVVPL